MGRHRAGKQTVVRAALVVSLAVLVATPVGVLANRSRTDAPADVGSRAAVEQRAGAVRADLRTPSGSNGPRPVALDIPAIDVSTSIVSTGVTTGGGVAVPDNIALVGWYRFGPRPGAASGSAVLVGHRDGRSSGAGALFRLGELRVGDRVSVIDANWQRVNYRVIARESFRKSAAPLNELFSTRGLPRLTLISCGGRFLADRGSYEDNVVVTAVPVGGTSARAELG